MTFGSFVYINVTLRRSTWNKITLSNICHIYFGFYSFFLHFFHKLLQTRLRFLVFYCEHLKISQNASIHSDQAIWEYKQIRVPATTSPICDVICIQRFSILLISWGNASYLQQNWSMSNFIFLKYLPFFFCLFIGIYSACSACGGCHVHIL